jgi:hypothetical protein
MSVGWWSSFALLTGLATLLGLALTLEADVLKRGWLVAWLLLLVVVSAIPLIVQLARPRQDPHREQADLRILAARMGDWRQNSAFMRWLAKGTHDQRIPVRWAHEIDEAVNRWAGDSRRFRNRKLGKLFDATVGALADYNDAINEYMKLGDGDSRTAVDSACLVLPMEWKVEDQDSWFAARDLLGQRRIAALTALRELFAVAHKTVGFGEDTSDPHSDP